MATTFELTISVPNRDLARAENCLSDSHRLITRLESQLSEYLPESPMYQLNSAPPFQPVSLNAAAFELFELSAQLENTTQGAFSIAAKGRTPLASSIAVSKASRTASRLSKDSVVSFGAIGKGYALDRVRDVVESWGFHDYLLSAGGSSLIVSGFASPKMAWTVGWSTNGATPDVTLMNHLGHPIACGISGISEKGFHILDPRTTAPATAVRSAFVSHPSATVADALSTALFVLGWNEGLAAFDSLLEKPCLALFDASADFFWNGTFQNTWGKIH